MNSGKNPLWQESHQGGVPTCLKELCAPVPLDPGGGVTNADAPLAQLHPVSGAIASALHCTATRSTQLTPLHHWGQRSVFHLQTDAEFGLRNVGCALSNVQTACCKADWYDLATCAAVKSGRSRLEE
jgi:hypothetical protein